MNDDSTAHSPPTFEVRCRVRPAMPVVNIHTALQTDELHTRDSAYRYGKETIVTHELAPENHAILVAAYREGIEEWRHYDANDYKQLGMGAIQENSATGSSILAALNDQLRVIGKTEITDDGDGYGSKIFRASCQIPALRGASTDTSGALNDFVCNACMNSGARDEFLSQRTEALDKKCAELVETPSHKNDEVFTRRLAAMKEALRIDPGTGHVLYDDAKYQVLNREIIEEKVRSFETRIRDLSDKMVKRAAVADRVIRRRQVAALQSTVGTSKSDPFAPPSTRSRPK